MNLSKFFSFDWKNSKNVMRWVIAGAVVLFLAAIFISSYIDYKTGSTTSYQPAYNDDEGFKRLYQDLTKDKPKVTQQKQALAEASAPNGKVDPPFTNVDDWVAQGGWKNTPQFCDSLRVQYAMLAFAFGKLVEENEELKKQVAQKTSTVAVSTSTPQTRQASNPVATRTVASSGSFDFSQYFNGGGSNTELTGNGTAGTASNYSEAAFTWATLSLSRKLQVRSESLVTFDVDKPFSIGGVSVPLGSKVSGTALVSQGVGRVYVNLNRIETPSQTITIEGEVYSLDRSRGINVFVHSESAVAEGVKRELTDWVGLIDPSRSGVSRNVLQDTDVGREYYANIDAGTMVLAKIKPRQ
jgi:hypothetical protein